MFIVTLILLLAVRTALLAMIGFMPTHGEGALGSLDYTADERKILAKKYVINMLIFHINIIFMLEVLVTEI